ncbi:hypothetical protein [Streptococcus sobrinus]|uniref:Double glycine cleavage site bacteriolysin n=1 Tax=Streptococcus sobrinus W1703 TaxID=1227275 RepID=U2KCA6_9STRE|nr:hypothetical protein [Streptococcus sobrinus]ERJ74789.1 double glycine cleavage site bacteriolysin [Streptococcus sobrinus W1703]
MKFNFDNYEKFSRKELSAVKGGDWWQDFLYTMVETSMPIGWNWYQKK